MPDATLLEIYSRLPDDFDSQDAIILFSCTEYALIDINDIKMTEQRRC